MFDLRDYQQTAVDATLAALDRGVGAPAMQLATGAGKTVVLAEIIRRRRRLGRALCLVHRRELVDQIAATVGRHLGCPVGIEQGGDRTWFQDPVVVASVPTVGRDGAGRLGRFDPSEFATVVIDEVHHAVPANKTYGRPLEWAGLLDEAHLRTGRGPALIGCSATLRRSDGKSLARWFDEVVADVPLRWLIDEGYLAPLRGILLRTGVLLDQVRTTAGDFVARDLETAVNVEDRNQLAVNHYVQHASDRQFLAFVPGVQHALDLAEMFRYAGVPCAAVSGKTPADERASAVRSYRQGKLSGLVNVGVFTEGTDLPNTGAVYMLRPTMSQLVYSQMVGRGTRQWTAAEWNAEHPDCLWEGESRGLSPCKRDCLIVDLVDNTSRHQLMAAPSLLGNGYENDDVPSNVAAAVGATTVSVEPVAVGAFEQGLAVVPEPVDLWDGASDTAPCNEWFRTDDDAWHLVTLRGAAHVDPVGPLWMVSFDDLPYLRSVHLSLTVAMNRVDKLILQHLVAF